MAQINKGTISTIEGEADRNGDKTAARVLPDISDGVVTRPLVIPWHLRGEMGKLKPGDGVVFVEFEDGEGIILARTDGEWPGIVPGDVDLIKGTLTITDKDLKITAGNANIEVGDVTAENISLKGHIHNGVHGATSPPL